MKAISLWIDINRVIYYYYYYLLLGILPFSLCLHINLTKISLYGMYTLLMKKLNVNQIFYREYWEYPKITLVKSISYHYFLIHQI